MRPEYKALIFDLDGTLLDTLDDLAACGNRTLSRLGCRPHPVAAYRLFVGDGLQTLVERMLPPEARSIATIDAAVQFFKEDYSVNWNVQTSMYKGIAEMLDELTAREYRLSILSNKPDAFTRVCVRAFLNAWTFEPLFGQRPGVPKKPHPAGAIEIAGAMQINPAEILYVGDSGTDMATAAGAGMDAVGVLWGFRQAAELRAAGARSLIQSPDQLLDLLSSP